MLLGLQIAMYHVDDLEEAKVWYTQMVGYGPYFEESYYVGFNVGGQELGLHPASENVNKGGSTFTYWGVKDLRSEYQRLQELGAMKNTEIQDVGGGILVATLIDPWGNIVGLVENPNYRSQTNA